MFLQHPSCKESRKCVDCSKTIRRSIPLLTINLRFPNLKLLEVDVNDVLTSPTTCRRCDAIMQRKVDLSSQIFLELMPPYGESFCVSSMEIALDDIPKELHV